MVNISPLTGKYHGDFTWQVGSGPRNWVREVRSDGKKLLGVDSKKTNGFTQRIKHYMFRWCMIYIIYIYNTYILYIYTYTYICVYIYICIGRDRWYRLGVANPNKTQCLQLVNTLCHSIIPNQPGKTQTTDHQASCRGYIIHLYLNIWWLKPFHHCWWSTK